MGYTVKLPATYESGEKKGQPAFVVIANEKLGYPADERKDGKVVNETALRVPQGNWEYPQFGPEPEEIKNEKGEVTGYKPLTEEQARVALEEFIVNAGSAARAAEIVNDATRDAALYEGKSHIRLAEEGEAEQVVKIGLSKSRDFTWKTTERVSVKEIKAGMESLREDFKNLTPEQIAARVAQMLKIG